RSAPLNCQPRRLVEDGQCLVAMHDGSLQPGLVCRPRLMRRRPRLRGEFVQSRDPDRLTRFDAVAGARPLAVDTDAPRAQQLLELAMAQCRIMALEPAVEAKR